MIDLSPDICRKIKIARRDAGLSQSLVAKEVGCLQSALSMFEQGDGTKLNEEVIRNLCQKFNIELPKVKNDALRSGQPIQFIQTRSFKRGFCPNPHCPTNIPYIVEGRELLRPDLQQADPVGGKFCAFCGEVLEKVCPHCGAEVHLGGICSFCGKPYISTV